MEPGLLLWIGNSPEDAGGANRLWDSHLPCSDEPLAGAGANSRFGQASPWFSNRLPGVAIRVGGSVREKRATLRTLARSEHSLHRPGATAPIAQFRGNLLYRFLLSRADVPSMHRRHLAQRDECLTWSVRTTVTRLDSFPQAVDSSLAGRVCQPQHRKTRYVRARRLVFRCGAEFCGREYR